MEGRREKLPNMRGKEGRSTGFSGAPTMTSVPFTFNNSSIGPTEWWADTVSSMKSRAFFFAYSHHQNKQHDNVSSIKG